MRRVSPTQSDMSGILAQRAVNHIWVKWPTWLKSFAVIAHRTEQRPFEIITMSCKIEIVTDTLCGLWVNGKALLLAAFAHDLQGIEAAVDMEIPDFEARNLRTPEADLQSNSKHGTVTHTEQRIIRWCIENRSRLFL